MRKKNEEITNLIKEYGISSTYLYKLIDITKGDKEALTKELKAYAARKANKIEKKNNPIKKQVNISTTDAKRYPSRYTIKTPDHLMGRDEFYLWLRDHVEKSVTMLRGKYWTLRKNNISNEDLVQEIMIKCIRPTKKEGLTVYDKYIKDPNCLITVRRFVNMICTNHFIDYLKGPRFTTDVDSLDRPLPGSENITLGDTIGEPDKESIYMNELRNKCTNISIKNTPLVTILDEITSGKSLSQVCKDHKVHQKEVRKKFIQIGIEEILGIQISPETRQKALGEI